MLWIFSPEKSDGFGRGVFFFLFFLPGLFISCSIVRSRPIELRAVDFSIMKNPTASVGSEPAILGSRGQHANP
jgi:hypothetical protein